MSAPTGLENFVGGSATKISLLTELAAVCKDHRVREGDGEKFGLKILPPPGE